ncbi:hypothetical protein C8R48DRAFT_750239 [Suillus tomentosus]|nr:hypothetical protein C8R48DRAFT_750239 [Suillus tomentosus]
MLAEKVVILCILMQNLNQNLNVLQSIVIDTLSRMGVTILALSAEFHCAIHALGQTLLASYAYDNFNVDLKKTVHTVSESEDMLHGVTCKDLQCSMTLWEKSPLNLQLNLSTVTMKGGWKDLLWLHPESLNAAGLSHRDCFNSWKMLCDLINHSPLYFRQFKDQLGDPERVDSIPVIKTPILTAHAMHLSNSTVSGNISRAAVIGRY